MITQHRPAPHAACLVLLVAIGAVSAVVLAASAGVTQWLAGTIALVAPVLAGRTLSRTARR